MTVSPGTILILRWSSTAMRDRAAIGSPWTPVVMTVTCCGK